MRCRLWLAPAAGSQPAQGWPQPLLSCCSAFPRVWPLCVTLEWGEKRQGTFPSLHPSPRFLAKVSWRSIHISQFAHFECRIQGLVMKVATLQSIFKFSFDRCLPQINSVLQKGLPEPQSMTFGNTVFADVLVKVRSHCSRVGLNLVPGVLTRC